MTAMQACLVWDGGDAVRVPPALGKPLPDQLTGTTGEQLIEVGTRLCYDSLGEDENGKRKGRATEKTIGNVMAVYHGSVLEHYVRTVAIAWDDDYGELVEACLNRPGVYVRFDGKHWRVTTNVRAVHEWGQWTARLGGTHYEYPFKAAAKIRRTLRQAFADAVPLIVKPDEDGGSSAWHAFVEPETDAEMWVSMYLVGSRGFSHEMVRHRFAMSQRSTRYCGEGESTWHWHPLIDKYLSENEDDLSTFSQMLQSAEATSRSMYCIIVDRLESWLLTRLPEDTPYRKKTARKQARGAARGFLGNALETQMLFTAPVWAWKHIANMRAADAADAEIRVIIADALAELRHCRYSKRFEGLYLSPASDGIGASLASGGHK